MNAFLPVALLFATSLPMHGSGPCVCALQRSTLGAHADKFEVSFTRNLNPAQGTAHGHGDCDSSCSAGYACRVNGTLTIKNNSTWSVTVNWKGVSGGTPIAPGATGDFATGAELLNCGQTRDINFDAGGAGVVAHVQFKCNSCAVPPDSDTW